MFTGIIEALGTVISTQTQGTNYIFHIKAPFDKDIHVDQSIAHNGTCLTITQVIEGPGQKGVVYSVTAVAETLDKTQLGDWQEGTSINLERCMKVGARLDGHFVQGHVDETAVVHAIEEVGGSWMYEFQHSGKQSHLLVDKGSICVNGVSLTVVNAWEDRFTVTIIPFTHEHTTFKDFAVGTRVNLEFDILGKYIAKMMESKGGYRIRLKTIFPHHRFHRFTRA